MILLLVAGLSIGKEPDLAALHVQASSRAIRADNGIVSIGFTKGAEGLFLTSLRNARTGVELLGPRRRGDAIWRLTFRGPGGDERVISSAQGAASFSAERSERRLALHLKWKGLEVEKAGDTSVEVTVTLRAGSPLSSWRLGLRTSAKRFGLWTAAFPRIPHVEGEGLRLAAPFGWGLQFDEPLKQERLSGVYPGMVFCMQFATAWREGAGLYFAAHDAAANFKEFVVEPDGERGALGFEIVNYPAGMGEPARSWSSPYDAVVGVYEGGWYDGARLYRKWSYSAPWGKAGSVRERMIPRWLKDNDLWLLMSGVGPDSAERARRFAEFFSVPTAAHWYEWHQIPFDTLYPEYFPTREGFAEAVKATQAAGVHVMPYINGRLWDPASKSWTDEGAEEACAKKETLEKYIEVYGSKVPLAVMCPSTALWQKKVTGLVERLLGEVGVDGVYIDQICAAAAVLCFDPKHGHPPGGGEMWASSYRRLLDGVRRRLGRDNMITTEESTETWNDQFDALLLVNTPAGRGVPIPMFPAVYSGRVITFGFQYIQAGDLERHMPFRLKMARAFLFGAQVGWVGDNVLNEAHRAEAEYLRALARCRSRAHKFLSEGEMLAPLKVEGVTKAAVEGARWWGSGETFKAEVPAVMGSAWRAQDGSVGIALTNISDQQQAAVLRLSPGRYGLKGRKFRMWRIGPEGREAAGAFDPAAHREEMHPRSAVILEVRP